MVRVTGAVLLAFLAASCAPKAAAPPPLPTALKYADFMYPTVPPQFKTNTDAVRIDRGWRFLQNGDEGNAEREFTLALKRAPAFYPARAGAAYVALAKEDYDEALAGFDAVLKAAPMYVPALIGRGQALLALKRETDALVTFEAALAIDTSLSDLRQRVDVLRFRAVQQVIGRARAAAAAGRVEDARAAYTRALEASPESAFLHRELGFVERKQGNAQAALDHFQRASELDPGDAVSLTQIGQLLEERQDYTGADAAYRKAAVIEETPELTRRLAALSEKTREARLPSEFRAIAESRQITRGDLAALIGIRLDTVLRTAPSREVVITDTRGHWAASWITDVARAGVIEPFENHTFQPRAPLRRVDLAIAVSRAIRVMAATRPALRAHFDARPAIADMPAGHLNYPDVAVAVAAGIVPLVDGNRFDMTRPVSGAEALAAVDRLRSLAS
jgi:tetratricopeptide (TPR) repeat protein